MFGLGQAEDFYSHAQPSPSPSRLLGLSGGVRIGPFTRSQSISPPVEGAGSEGGVGVALYAEGGEAFGLDIDPVPKEEIS